MMTIHLLKVALKCPDVHEFARRQLNRQMEYEGRIVYPVWTSRKPKRMEELLDGGRVYWVVKNQIQCHQDVWGIIDYQSDDDAKPSYLLLCDPQLIRCKPKTKRAFQGWRYFEPDKAPTDIGPIFATQDEPPEDLAKELRAAGLL